MSDSKIPQHTVGEQSESAQDICDCGHLRFGHDDPDDYGHTPCNKCSCDLFQMTPSVLSPTPIPVGEQDVEGWKQVNAALIRSLTAAEEDCETWRKAGVKQQNQAETLRKAFGAYVLENCNGLVKTDEQAQRIINLWVRSAEASNVKN